MSEILSEFLLLLRPLLSPAPIGIMGADIKVCRNNIKNITEYVKAHKNELSSVQDETGTDSMKMFYYIYEIVDYFGFQNNSKEIQIELYLFVFQFISILGILKKYNLINSPGTKIFYFQINALDDKYVVYTELFPNLISKTTEVCSLKSSSDGMLIAMAICKLISAATKIIVNHEGQFIRDGHIRHFKNAFEQVLTCSIAFLESTDQSKLTDGFKNIISELIYRIELSSNLLGELKDSVQKLLPFVQPIERKNQIGRTHLRVAIISAEMDLRKILIALRCYQFSKAVELTEIMLMRLEMNSFYTSDHAGSGAMCFTGFSEGFNNLADQVLVIFENLGLWSHDGAVPAAELIIKVFINIFNIPSKRKWDGPWIALKERTTNINNILIDHKKSETLNKLYKL